jgi:FkbM family methyltransferase
MLFSLLRFLLVALTGHGYDRSAGINTLHHKLAYRLHKLLPRFGIIGLRRVPILPNRFMYVRAEDGGVAHQLLMYLEYEPFESQLVHEHVRPGMTIYNIGANLGYYALLASEFVGPSGKVFAFEPAPENLELLRRTITENTMENVEVISGAVSSRVGNAVLSLSATNSGDHQLVEIDLRDRVAVDVTTVDAFAKADHPLPDAIIMDVQGAELDVLLGAEDTLRKGKPDLLFVEFWPQGLNERHENGARRFLEILEAVGFTMHLIDEKRRRLAATSTGALLQSVVGNSEVNLLCTRAHGTS